MSDEAGDIRAGGRATSGGGTRGRLAGNSGEQVFDLAALGAWAARNGVALPDVNGAAGLPTTILALLQLGPDGMAGVRAALAAADKGAPKMWRWSRASH